MSALDRARWAVVISACILFGPMLLVASAVVGAAAHGRDWWESR